METNTNKSNVYHYIGYFVLGYIQYNFVRRGLNINIAESIGGALWPLILGVIATNLNSKKNPLVGWIVCLSVSALAIIGYYEPYS